MMENYHLAGCDVVTNLEPKQMGVDEEEHRDHMATHQLDLKVKLEKATKQAESVETYAKKAINDAHDAQASGKAVASTTYCYKICIDNFVVSSGISGEDKSLEDHVSKLVKAIPFHARAPADMAVEVPGQEGDVG
ncbi:hypothetical protein ACET3Z_026295 [Daucus carota]